MDKLFAHGGLADAQRPHAARRVAQLVQHGVRVGIEVLVEDDVDARVVGVLGHGHGSSAQNGDLGDGFSLDHGVEHAAPHEAGRAGQDEMHFVLWGCFPAVRVD